MSRRRSIGQFAGPGHWNDPDLMQLGMWVSPFAKASPPQPIKLPPNEQYSYMSLWCLMAAPLIYSGDVSARDDFTRNILCNPEVIGVDQDRLGKAARVVRMTDNEWVLRQAPGRWFVGRRAAESGQDGQPRDCRRLGRVGHCSPAASPRPLATEGHRHAETGN